MNAILKKLGSKSPNSRPTTTIIGSLLLPVTVVIFIAIVIIGTLWIQTEFRDLETNNKLFEEEYLQAVKEELINEVSRIHTYLINERIDARIELEERLKSEVDQAYALAASIVANNAFLDKSVLQHMIFSALRDFNPNDGRSYFYVGTLDGQIEMYPPLPEIEGIDPSLLFNEEQMTTLKSMVALARNQKEGFIRYQWLNPLSGKHQEKYSYIKAFETYNWFIGVGDFIEDFEVNARLRAFQSVASIRYGKNNEGYFFINSLDGRLFVTNNQSFDGSKNIIDLEDSAGKKVVQENIRIALENPEGGFSRYFWPKIPGGEPVEKIAYILGMKEWNIFIGTGVYLDTMQAEINARKDRLEQQVIDQIILAVVVLVASAIIVGFTLMLVAQRLQLTLSTIQSTFDQAVDKRVRINYEDLYFKEFIHMAESANRMIDGLNAQAEELRHHAQHDHLTALPNRKFGKSQLGQMIEQSLQDNTTGALLFLDLDNFKEVNDTLGHSAGDELLQEASERLRKVIREGDTIARLGGDEFTVITGQLHGRHDAEMIAEKLCQVFDQPFMLANTRLHVTASVGVTLFPDDGDDAETLLKNADSAMYESKRLGRNRYSFYTPELTEEVAQRVQLVDELRVAIEEEQFELYYQPQVCLATGELIGAEALIRWQHPQRGLVSPVDFIPYAEYSGQISAIGKWVLLTACQQMTQWQQQDLGINKISVNVSSRQLRQDSLIDMVKEALAKTGCKGHWLELEITESMLIENPKQLRVQLEALQKIGVCVSVDDFGTGYSSLSYIKQLPIDALKIDRSFIRDIHEDENDRAITKAIISMGHSLNLEVLAEGVENEEQIDFLKSEGCRFAQGYYFSKPLSTKSFNEYLSVLNQIA